MSHINAYPSENDPLAWGIFLDSDCDWLYNSDDLTVEQAAHVVELLRLYWPTIEHIHQAFNDGTIDRIDRIVAAVKANDAYVVHVVHQGTAKGIFRATANDIVNGWAMSHEDAIERAHESFWQVFDFGAHFYQDEVQVARV